MRCSTILAAALTAMVLTATARAIPADPLATLVGNRVASETVDCIDRLEIDKVRIVAGVGILYEMKTGPLFLNRPAAGRNLLHDGIVLAIDPASNRLCSVELVRVINPNSRAATGAVTLGKFTAYRMPVTP